MGVEPLAPGGSEPPRFKGKWITPPGVVCIADKVPAHRVIVITAAPGSGKSRLMKHIHTTLQSCLYNCCWLRLRASCSSPRPLASDIAWVLQRQVLGERSATAALSVSASVDASTVLSVALNEVSSSQAKVALFIDDIQMLDAAGIGVLQRVIEEAPHNMWIILASRGPTDLHLARLRNEDALLEIDDAALAISFKQLADVVAEASVPSLSLAETRDLWHRTNGWVAAVRLLARNRVSRTSSDAGTRNFTVGRDIQDYFEEELLGGLSDGARGALDVMLIPEQLDRNLMLEISDDSKAKYYIDEYVAQGLLKRDPRAPGMIYRAIPLLLDVLAAKRLTGDEERTEFHRRCSQWFERRANLPLAASHAMGSADPHRAIELIERCGFDMIANGEVLHLQAWLQRFAIEDLRLKPLALLAVAWALALLYRLDEAEALIDGLEKGIESGSAQPSEHARNVSALRVMIASMRDDFRAGNAAGRVWKSRWSSADDWFEGVVNNSLAFCLALDGAVAEGRMALESAYSPQYYERGPYAAIYGRCILGLIDLRDGQVRRAEAHFNWALKHAEKDMSAHSTGTVMSAGLLAGALYERNQMAEVDQLIESYAWSLHAHLFTDARFQAYRAKARHLSGNGQYRGAIAVLETVLDAGPVRQPARVQVDVLSEKVIVALAHHDTRMASAYLRALNEQFAGDKPDDPGIEYLEAARAGSQAHLHLALGSPENALDLLRKAARLDLRKGWNLRAFHWAVLGVCALSALGQTDRALRLFRRLIGRAAPNGIVRTFIEGGREIHRVLDALHASGWVPTEHRELKLVRQLREAFDPSLAVPEFDSQDNIDEADTMLTEREMELVRFVRAGLTNRQIAEMLRVSENTIKWHLKNVFEKANVKRRAELAQIDMV